MPRNIDQVEIKEPPIQELQKKRSCLWRSCTTGGGCILLFLIGSAVIIKFATTPRVKELKTVPDQVQNAVPLYDVSNADVIRFTAGPDRQKALSRAAAIPRLLLAPIIATLGERLDLESALVSSTEISRFNLQSLQNLLQPAAADARDLVQIEWQELPTTIDFIEDWYSTEFKKKQFTVSKNGGGAMRQFTFRKKDIDGSISIKDDPNTPATDYVLMTVYVP